MFCNSFKVLLIDLIPSLHIDVKPSKDEFKREMPVTREFFTGEEGIRGYCTLDFLDRAAKFTTTDMSMHGYPLAEYMEQLEPYEFLMRVEPYLETEELKRKKSIEVRDILRSKANNLGNTNVITKPPVPSKNAKNEVAKKILTRYTI